MGRPAMTEGTPVTFVVPHTLAFIREQMLAVETTIGRCSVVVARPRPAWMERSWGRRAEPPLDPKRFPTRRIFVPTGTPAAPVPLLGASLRRGLPPREASGAALLHAHFLYPQGYLAMAWSKRLGIPYVVTGHGYDVYRLMEKSRAWKETVLTVLRRAALVTTVSEFNRSTMVRFGFSPNHVRVIPNGYDPELFHPGDAHAARGKLGIDDQRKVILYVGNLVPVKQVDRLIDSFRLVREASPTAYLVIIGSGPEEKRLRDLVTSFGLTSFVGFLGELPHAAVGDWMRASNLVCLPSRAEGQGAVVLESLACGRPVVVSDVGDLRHLITSGVGIVVPAQGAESLATALDQALAEDWNEDRIAACASPFARPSMAAVWTRAYGDALAHT